MWTHNAREVVLKIASPSLTRERLELYKAFHDHGHQTKGWPAPGDERTADGESGLDLFLSNPFPTEEWSYWIGDRLLGLGYGLLRNRSSPRLAVARALVARSRPALRLMAVIVERFVQLPAARESGMDKRS